MSSIGNYIFYKKYNRRYRTLCEGLHGVFKLMRILGSQKIKNAIVHEHLNHYTVKFSSEAK